MTLINKIWYTDFEDLFRRMGYAYFTNGKYNLNIIGVRACPGAVNKFDDFIIVEYRDSEGNKCKHIFPATTDPGIYWLNNPDNVQGTAIMIPGQYRASWTFGLHKGQYEALVQCKPIKVYRDTNKDDKLDYNGQKIDAGMFGINIHKAGIASKQVDKWSAGCQVFANKGDFDWFISLCHKQTNNGLGNKFTYTLIDERDLDIPSHEQ